MEFIQLILKFIYTPKKTIEEMAMMEDSNKYGWYLILLFSVLYTFTVKKFDLLGLVPITDKFLIFPSLNYYYYETLIVIPVTVCAVYINYFIINKTIVSDKNNKNLWGLISFSTLIPAFTILWFYETFFILILNINHLILDILRIGIWILWTIYLTNLSTCFFNKNKYNRVIPSLSAIITLVFMVLFFR